MPPVDRSADAREFNFLFFGIAAAVLGPSSNPTPDERKACDEALARYLTLHPELKPRPELALLIAYGGWLGNRVVEEPTVRDRAGKIWVRSREVVGGLIGKLKKKTTP